MPIVWKFILNGNQTRILSLSTVEPLHVGDFYQSTANAIAKIFTQADFCSFDLASGWLDQESLVKIYVIVGTHVIFENYNNQHIKITHFVTGLNETCHNVRGLHVTDQRNNLLK